MAIRLLFLFLFLATSVQAAPPTRQSTYTPGATILSDDVTTNEDVIFNYLQGGIDTFLDGSIRNEDVAGNANIQSDKINLLSIAQNIANTGTFTNTGNATVTGTLTVSSTVTANSVTYATLPAGVVMGWPTTTAPNGWLLCDGSDVSRTTYSGLFDVIGTTFGSGNGSTTFTLPDGRGKNIIGYKSSDTSFDAIGETGGEKTHTLTTDEMPAHTHTVSTNAGGSAFGNVVIANSNAAADTDRTSSSTGGGTAHNVLDPYFTLNFIIKY